MNEWWTSAKLAKILRKLYRTEGKNLTWKRVQKERENLERAKGLKRAA